ncbi:hypothetical protein JTB14_025801 [Gonioctena quinquepunctata]|nr:hypothetical protein JTB14_025801 [Gonioctena quinquepunctata]
MITRLLVYSLSLIVSSEGIQLDLQVAVSVPGDIILGGLFPVHTKGDRSPCGSQIYHRGVQRLEAMMFAVDSINKNPNILPNVTLGVHILDTCSRDTYALNQSLQFVRASLNNIDTSAFECADHSVNIILFSQEQFILAW